MKFILGFVCCCVLFQPKQVWAQPDVLNNARRIVQTLCDSSYAGRGYVNNGVGKAAQFLQNEFAKLKLKPLTKNYFQPYSFSVNTQTGTIRCSLDGRSYQVGRDFLMDAASPSIDKELNLRHFNYKDSVDLNLLTRKLDQGILPDEALVLHHVSKRSLQRNDSLNILEHTIPLLIFTEDKKLTHTVSTMEDKLPSMVFLDSLIQNQEKIRIESFHHFIPDFESNNLIGYIPAKRKDSVLVFTAHYDHLGKQGQALFPGASDNASGVSMLLNLATYYSTHKPKYPTYFILFSGEEAGLLGSSYFVQHPVFDLKKIKLLVNLDIMGNAEHGITVVNGEQQRTYFDLLKACNQNQKHLPEINIRGKAANSDHYPFSEKGVPAIFIYTLGGQGFYHDIDDKYEHLGFKNYEALYQLLITFTQQL